MHLFDDARQTGKQKAQHDHDNPFPAGCRRGFAAIPQQPDGYKHDGDTDRLKNPKLFPLEYRSRERRDNHAVEHEQRRQ